MRLIFTSLIFIFCFAPTVQANDCGLLFGEQYESLTSFTAAGGAYWSPDTNDKRYEISRAEFSLTIAGKTARIEVVASDPDIRQLFDQKVPWFRMKNLKIGEILKTPPARKNPGASVTRTADGYRIAQMSFAQEQSRDSNLTLLLNSSQDLSHVSGFSLIQEMGDPTNPREKVLLTTQEIIRE
jgi:hypothetical protein